MIVFNRNSRISRSHDEQQRTPPRCPLRHKKALLCRPLRTRPGSQTLILQNQHTAPFDWYSALQLTISKQPECQDETERVSSKMEISFLSLFLKVVQNAVSPSKSSAWNERWEMQLQGDEDRAENVTYWKGGSREIFQAVGS